MVAKGVRSGLFCFAAKGAAAGVMAGLRYSPEKEEYPLVEGIDDDTQDRPGEKGGVVEAAVRAFGAWENIVFGLRFGGASVAFHTISGLMEWTLGYLIPASTSISASASASTSSATTTLRGGWESSYATLMSAGVSGAVAGGGFRGDRRVVRNGSLHLGSSC